jgi:hypothetical protein
MAGPLDTGQLSLTFAFLLPTLFSWLISELNLAIAELYSFHRLWHSVRLRVCCHPLKHRKKKIVARPPLSNHSPRTYLLMAAAMSLFRVGCCMESLISNILLFSHLPRTPVTSPLLHRVACRAGFATPLHRPQFASTPTPSKSGSTTTARSQWSSQRTFWKTSSSTITNGV